MSKVNHLLGLQPQQLRLVLFTAAALLRLVLLAYGEWQDSHLAVKFTDIDYKVYTDAAGHVLKGGSPYDRHTYRYSPLVAYICLPNLLGVPFFGKLLFCCVDMAVALLIEQGLWRIHLQRQKQQQQQQQKQEDKASSGRQCERTGGAANGDSNSDRLSNISTTDDKRIGAEYPLHTFLLPCCCWLFHPVVATVSARGNADSIPCLLVLLTLAAVRAEKLILSAVLYGVAVHFKLYPVIYGVPILLYMQQGTLPDHLTTLPPRPKGLCQQLLWGFVIAPLAALLLPFRVCYFLLRRMGRRQWAFGLLSVATCCALGCLFYYMYGFPFVFESYLYHATRSDHRHNMSPYFYLLYLDSVAPVKTVAFVALNKVCTTQYFLWWLCLLPFAVGATNMKKNTLWQTGLAMAAFQAASLLWLFFGYKLEFEGKPVFLELSFASAVFTSCQMGLVVFFSHKIRSKYEARRAKEGDSLSSEAAVLERKRV
ncbi:GPI mannosyltransferase 1, putative [Eimeria praecox]|uniref:GPI mannosyltransferase 1 n=1 Tax=Eimeria praecox TaxID=51316 RepID=U6G6D7_9EIME|nr:GPI mannosyltransferase 1, putative [Eimeria praecox]